MILCNAGINDITVQILLDHSAELKVEDINGKDNGAILRKKL